MNEDNGTLKGFSEGLAETIAAISTPPGRGGIGIVRLSGSDARAIAEAMVRVDQSLLPGRARFAVLADPEEVSAGDSARVLDEVVVTYFAGPLSYTGEDVVEIAAHGSPVVLEAILREMLRRGARLAMPGEFTQRAFLSGRLDLTQAEAVQELIAATTLHQARVAARQMGGSVSAVLAPIKQHLIGLIALLEAGIDFAEDDLESTTAEQIDGQITQIAAPLGRLAASFAYGRTLREGFTLAIVGRPNAGKSSLFNALLARDRAIVTAAPGTTRDAITERLSFEGIPVELTDTAGLREAVDEAEALGVARTRALLAEADVVLLVVDLTQGLAPEDVAVLEGEVASSRTLPLPRLNAHVPAEKPSEMVGSRGPRLLVAANKADMLPTELALAGAVAELCARGKHPVIAVSALTGSGLPDLRAAVHRALASELPEQDSAVITSLRQHAALTAASTSLAAAKRAVHSALPHEMLLLDLHEALAALDGLTGTTTPDDILSRIFSTFCIGK